MTLEQLIAQFRVDADDEVAPYLASSAKVTAWLDEAQEEAAVRANLIHEATNPAVCTIAVVAGTMTYPVHSSVLQITYAAFTETGSTTPIVLGMTDRLEMDRLDYLWRTVTDAPRKLIQNDTTLQFNCLPRTGGVLTLEYYRTPLGLLEDTDTPEIGAIHHRHLVQWALHKCFMRTESEIHNPKRAEIALAEFTRVFGLRPDFDVRRSFHANRPQHNRAYF